MCVCVCVKATVQLKKKTPTFIKKKRSHVDQSKNKTNKKLEIFFFKKEKKPPI